MTLNYSNIPKWRDFLEIFNFSHSDKETIKKVWGVYNKSVVNFFSKSSWSIFLIVLLKLKKKKINVWVPSYYCEDALYLIKKLDINIFFYDVDDNFIADKLHLKKLLINNKPDIIIFCNFFGKHCFNSYLKEISKSSDSWLIEDATHCISPENEIGKHGDFVIYSPYKFFPIPTGAVLTTSLEFLKKNQLEILLSEKEQILILRKYFKILKFNNENNFFHNLKWILKKILSKFNFNFKDIKNFNFDEKISNSNYFWSPKLDYFSKNLLEKYGKNIEIEKEKRLRMLILWKNLISKIEDFKTLDFDLSFLKNNQIPYFAIVKDLPLNIIEKYNLLKKKKIPVLTWPNLPSDISEKSFSHDLRKKIFFLPLHDQSSQIFNLIKKQKVENLNTKLDNIYFKKINSKEEWERYFKLVSLSNISQSWSYGESQKKIFNLKSERYLIYVNDTAIGIFQVIFKKFLFFSFNRINRGPLFFDKCNDQVKEKVIIKIFHYFNDIKNLKFLSFSPELNFNEKNLILNLGKKSIYFDYPNWQSSKIDLLKTEEDLKSQLDIKWRNMLNSAIKEKIIIKEESTDTSLSKILKLNYEDQIKKNYKGINKKILNNYLLNSNYKIFNAYINDELISSICVSLHGITATYLIGWSNNLGRKKRSMNLLLWNTTLYLKKNNYKFFDLGGLDKATSYGIFRFKKGMGGEFYKLVGNYKLFF